ncbi:unnamed protein product [Didymodactylos carnosus]|uniref:Kinesin light chain n=1 Tax=Didymodactylos carnosus TaxID=1234261 RepID=A0A815APV0_9BILA|nr:unnamed protein product [Didymodactylos carnosus]CAF4034828.1 unnamed protein product [Didymodactylos carnosus]
MSRRPHFKLSRPKEKHSSMRSNPTQLISTSEENLTRLQISPFSSTQVNYSTASTLSLSSVISNQAPSTTIPRMFAPLRTRFLPRRSQFPFIEPQEANFRSNKFTQNKAPPPTRSIQPRQFHNMQSKNKRNLENFVLIWLDSNMIKHKNNSEQQLRSLINYSKFFDKLDDCINYMSNIDNEKIYLIVSRVLSERIISRLHSFPQLESIYILCSNQIKHYQMLWTKQYNKIRGTYTQIQQIYEQLKQDLSHSFHDLISLTTVSSTFDNWINNKNKDKQEISFIYSQILKEIFINCEYNVNVKQDFIEFCRIYYCGNQSELNNIDEFDRNYSSKNVIWWYSRECFLYHILNKALRTQDIPILYKMRFILKDLHQEIQTLHSSTLDNNNDHVITLYRESIDQSNTRIWNVKLTLPSTEDEQLKKLTDHIKKKINSKFCLASLGELPWQMGDYTKAEEYYCLLLNDSRFEESIERDTLCSHVYNGLGKISECRMEYEKALEYFKQSIEALESHVSVNDPLITSSLNNIGAIYLRQHKYKQALTNFEKSLEIELNMSPCNLEALATGYNNIGEIYRETKQYVVAFDYYKTALEKIQLLPFTHPVLGKIYNNMALLHEQQGKYEKATIYYENVLEIYRTTLNDDHPDLAVIYKNYAVNQLQQGKPDGFLVYMPKAIELFSKTLESNDSELISLQASNDRGHRTVTNTTFSVNTKHPGKLASFGNDNNGHVPLPAYVQQDPDGCQSGNALHENNIPSVAVENIEMEEITNVYDLSDTGNETDEIFESNSHGSKHSRNSLHGTKHSTLSKQQQDVQEHSTTMSYHQHEYGNFKRGLVESNLVT